MDAVDGSAGTNSAGWHAVPNDLATASTTPFFIAKDQGPQYLNEQAGYQVIQPMITSVQGGGNFTLSTIAIAKRNSTNAVAPTRNFEGHAAFEVIDGMLKVEIEDEQLNLIQGDVIFIPGGTKYTYWSDVAYTKFLHVGQGDKGLDSALIANGTHWYSPVWPVTV